MKKSFVMLCLPLLIVMNLSEANEYLIRVDGLKDKSLNIIELIENHALVIATEADISRLKNEGIEFLILDENPREKYYQIVYLMGEDLVNVAKCGEILDRYEDCVLLRTTEEQVYELNKLKVELRRLNFEPVRFLDEDPCPLQMDNLAPDTLIQKMVAAVSQDTIQSFILRLQRMYTRYATHDSNRVVAVNWIRDKLRSYGCDSVYFQYFSTSYGPNVVGIKRGYLYPTLRKYCLIGGHMDDVPSSGYAPGADANASGTAAVIEAARVMRHYRFENTIYYVAFNAEEQGLIGSDSFAARAYRSGDTILGVINYDMIGYVTPSNPNRDTLNAHYTTAVANCSVFVTRFYQAIADTYTQLKIRHVRNTGTSGASDHASFWRRGYKAMLGIERQLTPAYHTTGDTLGPHLFTNCGVNHLPFATQVIKTGVAALAKLAVPIHIVGAEEQKGDGAGSIEILPTVGRRFVFKFPDADAQAQKIVVYNSMGQVVRNLSSDREVVWDGVDDKRNPLPSGVYFISLKKDDRIIVRRVVLIR
ncbi:MAG: M20/M25/M40 family metallo-hydrolase [candidate division WOR-3 bacterium]|nr:M20/M25/M40 family metallo-hydrolase [candidate division WOR-3 bacterium]